MQKEEKSSRQMVMYHLRAIMGIDIEEATHTLRKSKLSVVNLP